MSRKQPASAPDGSQMAAISVSAMAALCQLSRSRFHTLVRAGVFPKAKQDGGRPHYPHDLIQQCLDIRRTGIGADGKVVLFNRRPEKKPARPATVPPPAEYPELVESLKALGLPVADAVVGSAVEAVFPDGAEGVEHGELVRRVFLHLQARRG
ncbi:MAG: hypothetical protein K2V38_08960 [Gemmataceae bacterium]|nr:hypothetical protein [Gemmataceae bacterium]